MSNQNLYLVGTVHIDLDGRERLDTLLDRLSPSIVALEFHKDRKDIPPLRKSPEEEQKEINDMLDESRLDLNSKQRATLIESGHRINDIMGYEFKSSRDYTQGNPASRLEYIDISLYDGKRDEFIKNYLEAMQAEFNKLAELSNRKTRPWLCALERGIDYYENFVRQGIQMTYERGASSFEYLGEVNITSEQQKTLDKIDSEKRNEAMAGKVRELYDENSGLVAVVGLNHLAKLKTKLEDLGPRVMTLAEYNSV